MHAQPSHPFPSPSHGRGPAPAQGIGSDTLQAVASSSFPVYFVSNLQPEQAATMLQERCGLPDLTPDSPRLYAGLAGGEQKLAALRCVRGRARACLCACASA